MSNPVCQYFFTEIAGGDIQYGVSTLPAALVNRSRPFKRKKADQGYNFWNKT